MNFLEEFERFCRNRNATMLFTHIKTGVPHWRLQIFEKDTAHTGGDMQILSVERPTTKECMAEGAKALKERTKWVVPNREVTDIWY